MTPQEFCYWLQGWFELQNPDAIDQARTETIKRHLDMVFEHSIDPAAGDEAHQQKLSAIHSGVVVTPRC